MAMCLAIEGDLIRRVVVIAAGPPFGRPVVATVPAELAGGG
jgi:hypothetical protein